MITRIKIFQYFKMESGQKVLVVGGGGPMGKIHVTNLKKLGATVGNVDFVKNDECDDNFIGALRYDEPSSKGYEIAIVSLPEKMSFTHCKDLIESGFKRIMLEAPGCETHE